MTATDPVALADEAKAKAVEAMGWAFQRARRDGELLQDALTFALTAALPFIRTDLTTLIRSLVTERDTLTARKAKLEEALRALVDHAPTILTTDYEGFAYQTARASLQGETP